MRPLVCFRIDPVLAGCPRPGTAAGFDPSQALQRLAISFHCARSRCYCVRRAVPRRYP
jgi:hypothetical protein